MRRVLIVGCSGAGKTTLARTLAKATGLPLIHLDRHFWQPGWVEPGKAEWQAAVGGLARREAWIMDGNYGGTLPERLARADTVIHLDVPTWLCLWRVLRRTCLGILRPGRDDLPEGCRERIDWAFLGYVRRFRRDHRPRLLARLADFPGRIVVLRSRRETSAFIRGLDARPLP